MLTPEQQALVTQWDPLCQWVISRMWGRWEALRRLGNADVQAEARLALCLAAKNFDPGRGVKFKTYAIRSIQHYLARAATNNSLVHVPGQYLLCRPGTNNHRLAEASRPDIQRALNCWESGALEWILCRPGKESPGEEELALVRTAVDDLRPERDSICVRLRWLEGWTPSEIAEKFGISRSAVGQRLKRGLTNLRTKLAHLEIR